MIVPDHFVRFAALLCTLLAPAAAYAVELRPETLASYNRYIRALETRLDERIVRDGGALWANTEERRAGLRRGEIASAKAGPKRETRVPDGLIHDLVGAVFIPDVTLRQTVAFLQDYDNHKNYYQPEVIDSKIVSRGGNNFRVVLRLLKNKALTVVLNTEHEVHYTPLNEFAWWSRSHSTRINEIENAGHAGARELPDGTGHGYLWRLNSYWTIQERDGGTYVECEAVSLTRSVPRGLAWLINPIIRRLPEESLVHTLRCTRDGLLKR
jgi:hypothetical protein